MGRTTFPIFFSRKKPLDVVTIGRYNQDVKYEWDETKRNANIRKHGIDFLEAVHIFDGDVIIIEDDRYNYGETRHIAIGLLQERVIVVAYAERNEVTRIISARKATHYEQINYFEQIAD